MGVTMLGALAALRMQAHTAIASVEAVLPAITAVTNIRAGYGYDIAGEL